MNVNYLKEKLSGTTPKRIWINSTRLREADHMAKVKQKTKVRVAINGRQTS